jgi:hypothetical protein
MFKETRNITAGDQGRILLNFALKGYLYLHLL